MYSKFGQFIHGKWQPSEKNETYDVINPATEDVIGKASKATKADVAKALKSAEEGFKVWKKTPPWQRSYKIRKIADLMRERKKELAKWLALEVGKPLVEGEGEVGEEQIFLNGILKKLKEYSAKPLKVDLKILEYRSISNQ